MISLLQVCNNQQLHSALAAVSKQSCTNPFMRFPEHRLLQPGFSCLDRLMASKDPKQSDNGGSMWTPKLHGNISYVRTDEINTLIFVSKHLFGTQALIQDSEQVFRIVSRLIVSRLNNKSGPGHGVGSM